METTRQKKVSKTILKDLSKIFQKKTYEFLGPILVTITDVAVTRDLSIAKVYLSLFPSKDPNSSLEILNSNKSYFRKLLAKELKHQLRIIPEIIFYLDDSASYSEKIDKLLKK